MPRRLSCPEGIALPAFFLLLFAQKKNPLTGVTGVQFHFTHTVCESSV